MGYLPNTNLRLPKRPLHHFNGARVPGQPERPFFEDKGDPLGEMPAKIRDRGQQTRPDKRLFSGAAGGPQRLLENTGARNPGGDPEGCEHGRYADETQKLIE